MITTPISLTRCTGKQPLACYYTQDINGPDGWSDSTQQLHKTQKQKRSAQKSNIPPVGAGMEKILSF